MEISDIADIPLQPRPAGYPVPLTPWQLRLWKQLVKQGKPLSVRMRAASVRLLGPLNTCLLRRSIELVVQRHESLRTRIISLDGIPRQHIDAAFDNHLEVTDLSTASPTTIEREALLISQEFVTETIDLSAGPLFAAKLLKLSKHEHVLILGLDHMITDAVSCGILTNEIWTLYRQATQGLPLSLPQLPLQFADYAVWQEQIGDAWLKKHEAHWRKRLTGVPRIHFPPDDGPAEANNLTSAMRYIPFGKALSAKLRDFAQRQRTLLPLVVLAVFAAALSHWFKQRDFIIFFNSHGRYNRPELENMIGFLSSGLFLRMEIIERDSFHDLLQRTHLEFYSACKHQGAGLVPGIVPECTTDVVFNWNWLPRSGERKFNADGQVKIQPFPIQFAPRQWIRNEEAQIKLLTMFSDSAAGIVMTAGSGLFVPTTIERFGRSVRLFAEEFAERPLVRVSSVAFAR